MYLIDTNVIIYYFDGIVQARDFLDKHAGHLAISTITISEVLSFNMSENDLQATKEFLEQNFVWLDVSREIIFKSAEIRRTKKIKTPDALIGATALCHQLSLVSRNEKDFLHLPITLINPIH